MGISAAGERKSASFKDMHLRFYSTQDTGWQDYSKVYLSNTSWTLKGGEERKVILNEH